MPPTWTALPFWIWKKWYSLMLNPLSLEYPTRNVASPSSPRPLVHGAVEPGSPLATAATTGAGSDAGVRSAHSSAGAGGGGAGGGGGFGGAGGFPGGGLGGGGGFPGGGFGGGGGFSGGGFGG